MARTKRISAQRDAAQTLSTSKQCAINAPVVPVLQHLTDGATVADVNPEACIPMYLVRDRSENANLRLSAIIDGSPDAPIKAALTSIVAGAPTSVLVPLVGELTFVIDDHCVALQLKEQDKNASTTPVTISEIKSRFEVWYSIVDGCQLHGAIMYNRVHKPLRWGTIVWRVLLIYPGYDLDEYRKLAVAQNERNQQVYHYESTLYDLLRILRNTYDTLYEKQLKKCQGDTTNVQVRHKEVLQEYDGGEHSKNTTVKQAVSVASRLSLRTIEAIGSVLNCISADVILKSSELNSQKITSRTAVMSAYDCRLFKKILCTSTLRGSASFMNAVKEDLEED